MVQVFRNLKRVRDIILNNDDLDPDTDEYKDRFKIFSDVLAMFTEAASNIITVGNMVEGKFVGGVSSKLEEIANALFGTDDKSGFIARIANASNLGNWNFDGVKAFADILYELAFAIQTFYEKSNPSSMSDDAFNYKTGLENLKNFNWDSLLGEGFTSPTITPVITMSDEDKATLQTLQSLSGLAPTLTVSLANELDLPTKTDFTGWFETLFGKIDGFSKDLQSMRFTIYGSQFAQLIYPDIVKELAYDNLIGEHTSFK
jgi:hypothetical protein